jgi:hypothetical protein
MMSTQKLFNPERSHLLADKNTTTTNYLKFAFVPYFSIPLHTSEKSC